MERDVGDEVEGVDTLHCEWRFFGMVGICKGG